MIRRVFVCRIIDISFIKIIVLLLIITVDFGTSV